MSHPVYPIFLFGPCSYWIHLLQEDAPVLIGTGGHYPKQTHRNRFEINGPNKRQVLSIPIEHHSRELGMEGVKIAYREPWQREHLRSIEAAYRASAYFDYYIYDLQHIFSFRHDHLLALNLEVLKWVCKRLGLSLQTSVNVLSTPHAIPYIQITSQTPEISDEQLIFPLQHPYHQNFADRRGFDNNLSILDALMHLGPECLAYLGNKS